MSAAIQTPIIAFAGKGGVGKTIIAGMIARYLRERGSRVLLVDGDPAMGLAYLVGTDTARTLGGYCDRLLRNPKARREMESSRVKDLLVREALIHLDERSGMLIMGKDEGTGCFCGVNTVLKYGIGAISKDYDAMVIDCEAGLEQVKRRVLHEVNILLVISDMTARGLKTARQIAEIIARGDEDVILPQKAGFIINRYRQDASFLREAEAEIGLDLLATIPEDEHISKMDLGGKTIVELPSGAPSFLQVSSLLDRLGLPGMVGLMVRQDTAPLAS